MQMRLHIAVAALAVVWGGVSPLSAQRRGPVSHAPKPPAAHPNPSRESPRQNPVQELQRFEQMSPDDREKALSKLPPDRRARVQQQLDQLDKLTPEQRQRRFQ